MNVAVQSACVMMCATELCNETPDKKLRRSCLQTFVGICHIIVRHQVTKIVIFCTDILLLHMFIINEKLHKYQTPPSSGNIVPVTSSQVYSSVPVTCYTYDLSVLS